MNWIGTEAVRAAAGIEAWRLKGHALGATTEDLDTLLAEVEADRQRWLWSFDALQELDRRLMLRYAELRERPAPKWRDAAEHILASCGEPYTPADVDLQARVLERLEAPTTAAKSPA